MEHSKRRRARVHFFPARGSSVKQSRQFPKSAFETTTFLNYNDPILSLNEEKTNFRTEFIWWKIVKLSFWNFSKKWIFLFFYFFENWNIRIAKSNRFLKFTDAAKHIRIRTLHRWNPRLQFRMTSSIQKPVKKFCSCSFLNSSINYFFMFERDYMQILWTSINSTFMIFSHTSCPSYKRVGKSVVISNTSLP